MNDGVLDEICDAEAIISSLYSRVEGKGRQCDVLHYPGPVRDVDSAAFRRRQSDSTPNEAETVVAEATLPASLLGEAPAVLSICTMAHRRR